MSRVRIRRILVLNRDGDYEEVTEQELTVVLRTRPGVRVITEIECARPELPPFPRPRLNPPSSLTAASGQPREAA